ncbi:MAG TPA: hypothetical protein VN784_03255 [Candidatus Limnocylindrales bacterium]|nr:hypothetical protein [Candidatus Limnocylindrales bacterium]
MNTKLSRLPPVRFHRKRGFLTMDLIIGMAILVVAFMPLAFLFVHERQLLRAEYSRAVAVEIVDGEMEVLAAGEWQNLPEGQQAYTVHAQAAGSLPPGHFQLTRTGKHLRLEWKSDKPRGIGTVVREITVK